MMDKLEEDVVATGGPYFECQPHNGLGGLVQYQNAEQYGQDPLQLFFSGCHGLCRSS